MIIVSSLAHIMALSAMVVPYEPYISDIEYATFGVENDAKLRSPAVGAWHETATRPPSFVEVPNETLP